MKTKVDKNSFKDNYNLKPNKGRIKMDIIYNEREKMTDFIKDNK